MSAMTDTNISCCGKKMNALQSQKASENDKLNVEMIENKSESSHNGSFICYNVITINRSDNIIS